MAEEVNVPGAGKIKKTYVYAGVAIVVAAVGYYYYKNRSSSSTAASTTPPVPAAGTGTDPYPWDGTYDNPSDLYSMDSASGLTFGDEQIGYAGPVAPTGFTGPGSGDGGGGGPTGPPFSTNDQWSQYVIQYWGDNSLGDVPTLTAALGVYLQGQPMTTAQENLINEAIAIAGKPPVAGTGGYPPSMHITGSKTGGGGGGVPWARGLKLTPAFTSIDARWTASKGATGYKVTVTTQQASQTVASATVTGTSYRAGKLKEGTSYAVHVLAEPAGPNAQADTAYATTKKSGK